MEGELNGVHDTELMEVPALEERNCSMILGCWPNSLK